MKISEMTNDQATEVLIRISEPFANICDNDEMVSMLSRYSTYSSLPRIKTIGKILPELITYALKDHKQDVYEIVAALQMKPVSEIGKMNFKETLETIKNSYDEVLHDFFTSSVPVIKSAEKE